MKIETFIDWLKTNKQSSRSTVQGYSRILNRFNDYLKSVTLYRRSIEDTEKLTVLDIEGFIRTEKIKGLSARTCNYQLVIIRTFLNYAEHCGEKVMNFKHVTLMKETRKKIEALCENDKNRLLYYIKNDKTKDELTRTRDYAIVSVLLGTGLRVSELCNIKLDDVKSELQIIGKNNTLRLVYLFQEHINVLRLYLFLREGKKIKSDYLFCSHSGNSIGHKLSRASVEHIVKEAGIKAGLSEPVRPHKLRHTFATDLLRRGGNLYYIKELLGHSSILTTQNYLSVTNKDLRNTQELLTIKDYDNRTQQLEPLPRQYVLNSSEEARAINSDKYFSEYSKANFDQGILSNVQRGVGSYSYAY